MPEAYANNQENREGQGEANSNGHALNRQQVPKRQGSKYADILLQRLHNTLFDQHNSAVVGLVSFSPRQGVSTMAANLAIRASDHFLRPALLIDCNYNNQKLTRLYRCTGSGFGECLTGSATLESSIRKTRFPDLKVLGTGQGKFSKQIVVDPEIVQSFTKIIRNDYRFSVVDLPCMAEPSAVDGLIPYLDGVIIVARYGSQKAQLAQLQNRIARIGGKVLGVVMTGNEKTVPSWVPRFFR